MWKDNGSPREGVLSNIRRSTRAKYHYSLRYVRRNEEAVIANKMASSLLGNNNVKFWKNVKKLKGVKNVVPSMVDNVKDEGSIGNLFADKYHTLYNSVSYDINDMSSLMNNISENIQVNYCNGRCYSTHNVNINDMRVLKC